MKVSFRHQAINCIDVLGFYKRSIHLCKLKKYVKKNCKLKNTHMGESCYIFGNGPSVKELEFGLFKDKFVITVNQLARNPDFYKLKSNVHFWADYTFFNLDLSKNENVELFNQMKKVKTENNSPLCFFPAQFNKYITETGLDNLLDTHYFIEAYSLPAFMQRDNDFSSYIPAFSTVVHYAVWLANYMGFSKIYLFGCEMSSIVNVVNIRLRQTEHMNYAYAETDNERKRAAEVRDNIPVFDEFYAQYRALYDYAFLNEYCVNHGSHLYNCTPNTIVDSVPRATLEEALK